VPLGGGVSRSRGATSAAQAVKAAHIHAESAGCPARAVSAAEYHGAGRDYPDQKADQEHHDRHYDYGTGHDGLRGLGSTVPIPT